MDPNQNQQPNPLAAMMSLLGTSPAAAPAPPTQPPAAAVPSAGGGPQPSPAAMPQAAVQGGGSQMNPIIQALMGQAQQTMNNPMGQPVPQQGAGIDPSVHPLIAGLVKALATAAQSYGWTGMGAQEREERTQQQTQKAQALAQLGMSGTQFEMENEIRKGQLGVSQQNAETRTANEKSLEQSRQVAESVAKSKVEVQQALAKSMEDFRNNRIDQGTTRLRQTQQRISNQASQFEDMLKIRAQQVGIEQAKAELGQQGNDIRQQAVDVMKTLQAAGQETKAAEFDQEHYGLKYFFGGVSDQVQGMLGSPSAAPSGQAPALRPVVPQSSTTPAAGPTTKAQAKGGGGKQWNAVTGRYE